MELLQQAGRAGQVTARGELLRSLRDVPFLQAGLAAQIKAKGGEIPRKVITAPFVQIPLGVTEDRLVGTVDIEASMKVQEWSLQYLSVCLLSLQHPGPTVVPQHCVSP